MVLTSLSEVIKHWLTSGRKMEEQENSDWQKWASDVCEKNAVLETQNKTAHDKIQALEGALGALRTQHQTHVDQHQKILKQRQVYHGRIQALQSQYQTTKIKHQAEQSKRHEAQQQVWMLEASLERAQKQTTTYLDRNKVLEERVKWLESSNVTLDAKVQNLIRGQDFRSTQETAGKPHQYFQNTIDDIQAMIKSTVRDSFLVRPVPSMFDPDIPWPEMEVLGRLMWEICPLQPDVDYSHAPLKISIVVMLQATIAHVIYSYVITKPFFGCSPKFRAEMATVVHDLMAQANDKATRSWEAHCLRAYFHEPEFNPFFDSATERDDMLEANCNKLAGAILNAIRPLYIFFDQKLPTQDRMFALVAKAASLSRELGFLEASVSMMSYQTLSDASAEVRREWATLQNDDDDGDEAKSRFQGTIAMVLYPGLLKWGRDNGSNWGTWSVWSKARIEMVGAKHVATLPPAGELQPDMKDHEHGQSEQPAQSDNEEVGRPSQHISYASVVKNDQDHSVGH